MNDQELIANLVTELRRGTLTLAVLHQLHTPQYGYSLLQSLQEKNIQIEASTLYPLLRRLESQGLLESQWDTLEPRPRKYYVLSPKGIEIKGILREEWMQISNEMIMILKEE